MDNKNTPNMTINIENLHIHMDERMDSTNYYNPAGSCCDECDGCDCDCGVEISDEELIERIHKETGIPMVLIDRILKAEDKVLAQLYADRVDDEIDADEDETAEDAEDAEDEPSEEQTPDPNADKHPASEASKALAALAGLTLVGFLRNIVSEEDNPHED